jgi:hypothetical protein
LGQKGWAIVNRTEAYRKDRKGDFYVDMDEKTGAWGVFGSETGFCYATFSDLKEAERYVNNLTDGKVGS